jgi:pimeloyl-ACP methyl ester carboxylesterase
MRKLIAPFLIIASLGIGDAALAQERRSASGKPTVVLVHGAFADSASWNGVIGRLRRNGYPVVAAANPLRSLEGDARYVAALVKAVPGQVILVGHSYGGSVISEAAAGATNVRALVFVAGYAPDVADSAASLSGRFPGGTLGETLDPPVLQPDGGKDLYIAQAKFWRQFAEDVPAREAELMAVGQRPVTEAALSDPARSPSWKSIPSWFIWGSRDRNIAAALHAFMAKRAGAREAIEVKGASHVVMTSHPAEVAALIERAAGAD